MSRENDQTQNKKRSMNIVWTVVAFVVLFAILLMPTPDGLPVVAHMALAILAFAVIMWVTEAVSYPTPSVMILALIILLIGFSPAGELGDYLTKGAASGSDLVGTKNSLSLAFSGYSSSALVLVAAALFLAAAMQATNLHKRLALVVLSLVGNKTSRIVIGSIIVAIILAFFVPSATARAGAVIPILIGMITAFNISKDSKLAGLLVITAVQAVSIWNIGIKTAAAQNLVAVNFISDTMGVDISWGEWFLYAAPWSILMSIVLYFVMMKVMKPEYDEVPGGSEMIKQQLDDMGKISGREWRLIIISVLLLLGWATEKVLHPIDSSSLTLVAIAIMLMPKIGVIKWEDAVKYIPWGTVIVFGAGISLGSLLLNTGGAQWLSDKTFGSLGLDSMPILATIIIVSIFNVLIHLGFASATSLAAALIPVFISLTATLDLGDQAIGFVLIQQFVISFGFLLPISSPQGMLAYGTETFTVKQYFKAGVPLTIIGLLLIFLFSATYWKWIGLI
ncbi:hypothetical protein HMPREF2767_03900 [Nosocomiicoccus sp. HMSC067E10]|nr:DASS family sodium-coupled anion symporter [Nosocomiicoccus sp. HMSC067E10]OFL47306.1 hypothetical protein HMPREF2767_03900 [Nosocomiicoccus sp. HMSC067E10]